MKNREPHHFCGVLILLLALVSIYAWYIYPPQRNGTPLPIVVETGVQVPVESPGEPAAQPVEEGVPTTLRAAP